MTVVITRRLQLLFAVAVVAALGGAFAFGILRDLPSQIANGERARVAIQTLDAVRRPFLEIQDSVSALMNGDFSEPVEADFRRGVARGRGLIADFRAAAAYNPEVQRRVERLADSFEAWVEDERKVFGLAESGRRGHADTDALHDLEAIASRGFSLTMSQLGDVEGPLHDDIDRGSKAVAELTVIGGVLIAGLAGAAFFLMWSRNRALGTMLAQHERMEQALRDSDMRLNAFFTEAPAGLAIIDSEHRYERINETLARMGGATAEQHIGRRPSEFMPPEMAEVVENEIRQTLESGETATNVMVSGVAHDGAEHHWTSSRFPIQGSSGKTEAMGAIVVDITAQKRAEAELAQLNAELEQRVEDRTAELREAQAELLRAERLATLGQLTGTVAHEIRNPLGAVMSALGVVQIKTREAGLSLDSSLDRAVRGIRRCNTIVTELLDFARSRGFQPEPTVLDTWLADLLDEHRFPEGVKVVRECGLDDTVVSFDRDEFRRAVINVIDNACQAMTNANGDNGAAEQKELTVATRSSGERVEIEFDDTGPGIPEDVLPNIFEPLFSTKSFGVGLGLPIVRQVAEHHGGGLEISSTPGQGTKAVLWLPAEPSAVSAAAEE